MMDHETPIPELSRVDGMSVGYDRVVEARWLTAQRVAWVVLAVFVLAGLAGVFGRGPLAQARISDASGNVEISYDRFQRFRTPSSMTVVVRSAAASGSERIVIDRPLLTALPVQTVVPRPLRWTSTDDGAAFEVPVARRAGVVTITQQPASAGLFSGAITVNGSTLPLKIVVYP